MSPSSYTCASGQRYGPNRSGSWQLRGGGRNDLVSIETLAPAPSASIVFKEGESELDLGPHADAQRRSGHDRRPHRSVRNSCQGLDRVEHGRLGPRRVVMRPVLGFEGEVYGIKTWVGKPDADLTPERAIASVNWGRRGAVRGPPPGPCRQPGAHHRVRAGLAPARSRRDRRRPRPGAARVHRVVGAAPATHRVPRGEDGRSDDQLPDASGDHDRRRARHPRGPSRRQRPDLGPQHRHPGPPRRPRGPRPRRRRVAGGSRRGNRV